MNHLSDSYFALPQHFRQSSSGPSSSSALLLSASHRILAAKLAAAAAMTNGIAAPSAAGASSAACKLNSGGGSSMPSSTTSSSSASASSAVPVSLANSILYSAISAKSALSSSTFAIPQPPPPLVSASSLSYPTSTSSSSLYRLIAPAPVSAQPAPAPSVVIVDSDGHVSTTSTITVNGSSRGGGGGRGSRGARAGANPVGRPPKRGYNRDYGGHGAPPPTGAQVASVAGAHQNESHNSLAASMPLLSTYLMKGTINGYHNGHLMARGSTVKASNGTATAPSSNNPQAAAKVKVEPPKVVQAELGTTVPSPKTESIDDSDESVRFGRVPKREKAKILAAMQKVNAHSLDKALAHILEDEHSISATIAKAHEETCDYTREKVAPLLDAARSRPVYAQCPPQMTCPLNPIPAGAMDGGNATARILEDFSERFSPAIRGVVEFAKRIPGFSMLSQEDQVTLLKAGVFEVLLVRLACMFDSTAASMICLNGLVLRRDALHSASNARFLLDSMFDFAERLNSLRLSDHEIGLFCAVVVIAPDRPGIRNIDLVTKINKRLEEVLQKTIASNHPNDVASGNLIFSELTKKIPDLRTLNTLHSEKLLGKSFGVNLVGGCEGAQSVQSQQATSTSVLGATNGHLLHHSPLPMDSTSSSSGGTLVCPMQSAAASLIIQQHHQSSLQQQQQQQQQSQPQPDSSDNSPSDRWSSSSSLGHFSPATSTEDCRSVSPTSGPWNEHSKEGGFGSPRSMSSSSGVSSEDSHSRKGSISLPSAPPKLAYINSYVRGLSSPMVVSSEGQHPTLQVASSAEESLYQQHQQQHQQQQQQHLHPYSTANGKLTNGHLRIDSPTDSGIEQSGHSTTPTTSVCSSPARSSDESAKKLVVVTTANAGAAASPRPDSHHLTSDSEGSERQESIDDMPVLKRALQAPPLVNTNKLMDEAYRHHKKFRAMARRDTEPHSSSPSTGSSQSRLPVESPLAVATSSAVASSPSALSNSISSSSFASSHSTLLKTLEQPPRYLSEQQLKRTDLIHNIIMSTEAISGYVQTPPQQLSPFQAQLLQQSVSHSPVQQQQPKEGNLTQVMYPSGYYQHMPLASAAPAQPAVCPFTGRSSVSGNVATASASPSSGGTIPYSSLQAYAKSPEVAAAAAGLLVIGSSAPPPPAMHHLSAVTPSAAAASPSMRSLSPSALHQAPSPYSHLQRCLTATTAPLSLAGMHLPPTTASVRMHLEEEEEDAQPLNLSKKPSPPPSVKALSPAPSPAAAASSLKMEVE